MDTQENIRCIKREKKYQRTFFVTGHYIKTQKRFIVKNEG